MASEKKFVDIGGATGIGNASYSDGQWHYILATFEKGAGVNGSGKLQINVANQDGTTATISKDLSASFLGLPPAFNDGNFLVGAVDFNGIGVTEAGTIGPIPPKRFHGIIDEVQISRGIVPVNQRLGVLNLTEPLNIGDYNNDGTVNAADYTLWRDNLGSVFALQNRDPASTGVISQADYLAWKNRFGTVGVLLPRTPQACRNQALCY